jgi:NAD(P)-dependent dehydrogenase (short-subunit alcohol dehydrogenase family)
LLTGKNILITGASSGLGLASAKALAAQGANLTMLARTESKLLKAAEEIRKDFPDVKVQEQVVDVSNLDQVRAFAQTMDEPVDVLMNNAGVMGPDFSLSIEGIESQMATNHVGHFLLTKLLWQNLEKASNPRVISLSSVVHRRGNLRDLDLEKLRGANQNNYDRWQRYADTKLACLFFARELDIRAKQAGSKVLSVAAHPGWAITGLQDNFPNRFDAFAQSADQGARSQILAATKTDLQGGEFIGPARELWGSPKLIKGSSHSREVESAKRLWLLTEELTGERFEL